MYSYSLLESLLLVLYFSGQTLLELAPYVIGGVIVGELLKLTSWTKLIYRGILHSKFTAILLASVLGMVSPLCTYGTVPVVLQLLRAGVSLSPLVTFLSVSSMMNPQLFIYTWGWLGPNTAILRAVSVLVFGLLLGFAVYMIPTKYILNAGAVETAATLEEIPGRSSNRFELGKFIRDVFSNLQYVGFYMVIGVILSAVIDVLMPKQLITEMFKGNSLVSLFIVTAVGIPLYACGGGVLPVIRELVDNGMSRGFALSFLFVGPATRVTPVMALAAVLRPAFIVLYVMFVIAFALLTGIVIK